MNQSSGIVLSELETKFLMETMLDASMQLHMEAEVLVSLEDDEDMVGMGRQMQDAVGRLDVAVAVVKVRTLEFFSGSTASKSLITPDDLENI